MPSLRRWFMTQPTAKCNMSFTQYTPKNYSLYYRNMTKHDGMIIMKGKKRLGIVKIHRNLPYLAPSAMISWKSLSLFVSNLTKRNSLVDIMCINVSIDTYLIDILKYYKTQLSIRNALFSNSITCFFVGLNIDTVRMVEKLNRTLFSVMSHTHCASAAISHVDFFEKGRKIPCYTTFTERRTDTYCQRNAFVYINVADSCKTSTRNVCISGNY